MESSSAARVSCLLQLNGVLNAALGQWRAGFANFPALLATPLSLPASSQVKLTTPSVSKKEQRARSWPVMASLKMCPSQWGLIRLEPGALATTHNHPEYYEEAPQILAAVAWA
eukprot:1159798-Pelagomonas_calceolata.AAC.10